MKSNCLPALSALCLNEWRNTLGAIVTSLMLAQHAVAASFDCGKASTSIERSICANPQLSTLDENLKTNYERALVKAANEDHLKAIQRWWIAQVRNSCKSAECLTQVYMARLDALNAVGELSATNDVPPPASTALTPIEAAACRSVAEASNRSQLEGYEQRATQQQPSHEQFLKIFGPDNVAYDSVKYWHIDLDDNGIPDHFIISTQGTAHFTSAVGRLSHQGSTPTSLDDNGRIAADLSLLKIANRYYVLGSSDGPDKLWKWRNGGKLERLCIFPHREPIITLTADSVHAVCTAIPIGQTKPVEYPLKQSIEWLEDTRFFTGMRVLDGLALVDLNNDGYLDPVVRLEMSHAAGRGCDTEYLAITDATNTSVPDTPINRLLLSEIGGYSCGPKLSAFTFNSKTFLDARERNGDRVIYLISGTKASKVCTWKYQGIVEAVY